MSEELRDTGIDELGSVPWGTHFCHFYETCQDLVEVLVPYFRAGLENNEYCLWLIAEPTKEDDAITALRQNLPGWQELLRQQRLQLQVLASEIDECLSCLGTVVPDLQQYVQAGAIEVITQGEWYLGDGRLDPLRLAQSWKEKLHQAQVRGYAGMRVQGNAAWLSDQQWSEFMGYERHLESLLVGEPILVLCTYPLSNRKATEVFDVAEAHQFALARRRGRWELLEAAEHKQTCWQLRALQQQLQRRVSERTAELRDVNEQLRWEAAERQLAFEALQASEQRYRVLVDNSPSGIFINIEDRFGYVNRAFCELMGAQRPEELLGTPVLDRFHPKSHQAVRERIQRVRRSGQPVPLMDQLCLRLDGSSVEVETTAAAIEYQGQQAIQVVVQDVSAQRALRQSEQRFRELAETIDEVFWAVDPQTGKVVYVSPAFESVWQRTRESIYENPGAWLEAVHPEDRDRVAQADASLPRGHYDQEYRILRPDGEIRWIRDRAYPVVGKDRQVERIVGVARDITEGRKLEQQLRQAQKMEAIGQLAGGVAHDFNNLLAVILMQAELSLTAGEEPSEELREGLEQIRAAAERARNLTQQMLLFSRQQVMQFVEVDLNDVVTSIVKMLQRIIGEDVDLHLHLHNAPLMTRADAGMLDQLLLNLAVNSRDAMPRGGELSIVTSEREVDEQFVRRNPEAAVGRYVVLSVIDTGHGIPEEVLPRIFEPFFTTKEPGKGTGLGLATVYGIVKQHEGFVRVSSQVGHGTRFDVYLRAVEAARRAADEAGAAPKLLGGTETVLLVEDERAVRSTTRFALAKHGYRVLEAADGPSALQVWEAEQGRVDLLVTDLVMPGGMTGQELAATLRKRNPRLPVLFTSGYSADIAGRSLELRNNENYLQKPFSLQGLLRSVRYCLEHGS